MFTSSGSHRMYDAFAAAGEVSSIADVSAWDEISRPAMHVGWRSRSPSSSAVEVASLGDANMPESGGGRLDAGWQSTASS